MRVLKAAWALLAVAALVACAQDPGVAPERAGEPLAIDVARPDAAGNRSARRVDPDAARAGPASDVLPSASNTEASDRAAPAEAPSAPKVLGQGLASWYGARFHGRRTASGERYDRHALTAAHRSLPFGTVVRVRSLQDGQTVDVRINDRGPHVRRRIIDVSEAAALALGLRGHGVKAVEIAVVSEPHDEVGTASSAAP